MPRRQKKAPQRRRLAAEVDIPAAEVDTPAGEVAEVDMPPEAEVDMAAAVVRTSAPDPRFPIQLLLGRAPAALFRTLRCVVPAINLQ